MNDGTDSREALDPFNENVGIVGKVDGSEAVAWVGRGSVGMPAALDPSAFTVPELPLEVVALTDAGS